MKVPDNALNFSDLVLGYREGSVLETVEFVTGVTVFSQLVA